MKAYSRAIILPDPRELLLRSAEILLPLLALLILTAMPAHAQTSLGLDVMMAKFIQNINEPMLRIVYDGSYIFGVYLLVKGLFKCIKYSDEGSKGQQKFSGIWGTFLFGACLIALPTMVGTMSESLSLTNYAGQQSALTYEPAGDPAVGEKLRNTYWTIITFVQMIGLISFTRGLSILRSVTDGNTQVTSMAGLTHVIAGAMAWNLGDFVQMVGNTVGCTNIMSLACT